MANFPGQSKGIVAALVARPVLLAVVSASSALVLVGVGAGIGLALSDQRTPSPTTLPPIVNSAIVGASGSLSAPTASLIPTATAAAIAELPPAVPVYSSGVPIPDAPSQYGSGRIILSQIPAPINVLSWVGLPLDRSFRPLGGADGTPIFSPTYRESSPVNYAQADFRMVENSEEARASLEGLGVGSVGLGSSSSDRYLLYRVYRISRILEVDDSMPLRQPTGDAAFYVKTIYVGRAYYELGRSDAASTQLSAAGTVGNRAQFAAAMGSMISSQQAEYRSRGLVPLSRASFDPDAFNGYRENGPESAVLVDYVAVPGTVQSRAQQYSLRFDRFVPAAVGTDPFNQRPRWQIFVECRRNSDEFRALGEGQGVWDGTVGFNEVQEPRAEFSARLVEGDRIECDVSGLHHGGVWGRTAFQHRRVEWSPGTATEGWVGVSGGDMRFEMHWQVRREQGSY